MATFAPNTTVKETINVDYTTRITPQKVAFINRENEYYGSFHGVAEISGSTLKDPNIVGGTFTGTKFVDDEGKEVDLTRYAQSIVDLEEAVDDLSGAIDSRMPEGVPELVEKVHKLSGDLGLLSGTTDSKFELVDTRFSVAEATLDTHGNHLEEIDEKVAELTKAAVGGLVYRGSLTLEDGVTTFAQAVSVVEHGNVKTGFVYTVSDLRTATGLLEGKKVGTGDMVILKNIDGEIEPSLLGILNIEVVDSMDRELMTAIESLRVQVNNISDTHATLHSEIVDVRNETSDRMDGIDSRIANVESSIGGYLRLSDLVDYVEGVVYPEVDNRILVEKAKREEQDTILDAKITQETTDRVARYDDLKDRIDTEISNRQTSDDGIRNAISDVHHGQSWHHKRLDEPASRSPCSVPSMATVWRGSR